MSVQNLTAIIFGATGATGRYILREVLENPAYTKVHELGRNVTSLETLEGIRSGREKLVQKKVDFEKIDEEAPLFKELKADVVFLALGTTKAQAGSSEAFLKIDHGFPVSAATATRVEGHKQRLVYISSTSANPNSSFLYTKSKGLTEQDLSKIGYEENIFFQPGLLAGAERNDRRMAEEITMVFTKMLSHVSNSVEINVRTLAKSIVRAGTAGAAGLPSNLITKRGDSPLVYTISNSQALALAKDN